MSQVSFVEYRVKLQRLYLRLERQQKGDQPLLESSIHDLSRHCNWIIHPQTAMEVPEEKESVIPQGNMCAVGLHTICDK